MSETASPITREEYMAEGRRLFGEDMSKWVWKCPVCGHRQTIKDWKDAGAGEGAIAFACVGRWTKGRSAFYDNGDGPCDYTLGGFLIAQSAVRVRDDDGKEGVFFEFAPPKNDKED